MSSPIRRRFVFRGRVQGVGFRATTRSVARNHAVTGWVRNDPGGTVTMETQGEPAAVEAFLRDHDAELGANITARSDDQIDPEPHEVSFEIRY